jgi:hypothetical protein
MGFPAPILEQLDKLILPWGFDRRKTLYGRRRDGNIAVLYLYSPGWDPDFGGIDAHVGVLSGRLSAVFGPKMSFSVPAINGTHHWYRWAGDLGVPDQPESGWSIHRRDGVWDLDAITRQLEAAVLPVLEAHSSDEGLRDDWLVNRDTWISDAEQLAYLIVLMREVGPTDQVPGLQQRLRHLVANGDPEAEKVARSGVLDWIPR